MSAITPTDISGVDAEQRRATSRSWEMLIVCLLVVVGALALDVRSDQRVYLRCVPSLVLPPLCGAREMFGINCPGCGLTRSIIHFSRGCWSESLHDHRLGGLLAVFILGQIPYRIVELRCKQPLLPRWARITVANALIALLLGNWILDLANQQLQLF
jgi:hypothetical protein